MVMQKVVCALALGVCCALAPNAAPSVRQAAVRMDASSAAYEPTEGAMPPLIKNNLGEVWVPQMQRPRRNRKSTRSSAS